MNEKKLEHYGGDGFGGLKEIGDYCVKTETGEAEFVALSNAMEYYESIEGPKAFWSGIELIDAWQ